MKNKNYYKYSNKPVFKLEMDDKGLMKSDINTKSTNTNTGAQDLGKYASMIQMGNQMRSNTMGGQDAAGDIAGSTAGGVGAGAMVGGPWGAAIGGAIGLASGVVGVRAKRKAAKRQAEADHQARVAQIEQDKADRMRKAYATMASNIGATLRSV